MNKCPNNRCGERHSYAPKGTTSYVCEWCHQVRPDPEVEFLRARVAELEAYQRNAGVWMAELIEKNDHLLHALQAISEMTDAEAEFEAAQVAREALNP